MAPIRALPPALVAQIAAGEVVERPASIVKELIENALDAGATRLQVSVRAGGIDGITVQDNGSGIPGQELVLARTPHATSKLQNSQQLMQLESLGFRGEALASIASVSHTTLSAACPGDTHGWRLQPEDTEPTPCPHGPGTCVQVSELFHNIPARKKFLKTPKTEWLKLKETFVRLALSHPACSMKLVHEDKTILDVPGSAWDDRKRLGALMGNPLAQEALKVTHSMMDLSVKGWLCAPEHARSLSDRQAVFLNGRWLKDRLLQHAIHRAYEGLLPPGACPAYVLFVGMPPEWVDVNVHPSKHEVRFVEPGRVHAFVEDALRAVLEGHLRQVPQKQEHSPPQQTLQEKNTPAPVSESSAVPPHAARQTTACSRPTLPPLKNTRPMDLTEPPPQRMQLVAFLDPFVLGHGPEGLLLWHVRQAWEAWRSQDSEGCACSMSVAVRLNPNQQAALKAWGWEVQTIGHSTLVQHRPQEVPEHQVTSVLQACAQHPVLSWVVYATTVPFQSVANSLHAMDRLGSPRPVTSKGLATCWRM